MRYVFFLISSDLFKASAHSFKQFTSRLLKSTFSLSMHIYNSDGRHAWFRSVYYSTIQISFSDLKKEIGNHSVISNFYFQFEHENQKKRFNFLIFIYHLELKIRKLNLFSDFHFAKSKA